MVLVAAAPGPLPRARPPHRVEIALGSGARHERCERSLDRSMPTVGAERLGILQGIRQLQVLPYSLALIGPLRALFPGAPKGPVPQTSI